VFVKFQILHFLYHQISLLMTILHQNVLLKWLTS